MIARDPPCFSYHSKHESPKTTSFKSLGSLTTPITTLSSVILILATQDWPASTSTSTSNTFSLGTNGSGTYSHPGSGGSASFVTGKNEVTEILSGPGSLE